MKTLLLLALMAILTGCAHKMTAAERAQIAENWKRYQAAEEARINPQPGTPIDDVVAGWGNPDRKEFMNGEQIYGYDNDGQPMQFFFKDGRLTGYRHDLERERALRDDAERSLVRDERVKSEKFRKQQRFYNALHN